MTDKQFNGRLVLNVGPDLHQWLYERAAAHDMTMNKYARKLIRDELERHVRASEWNIDLDKARDYITYPSKTTKDWWKQHPNFQEYLKADVMQLRGRESAFYEALIEECDPSDTERLFVLQEWCMRVRSIEGFMGEQ
ncbi:TPA: toxin-antitoxin system HicB family antitoxin [Burkholderia vietnamiensis]|uniref:toxin-antitoxin system HicB family antitoxin n=1 Tax=Burkholderia vietnamiensis TaxID=60552 RepID=UPI001CF50281|nr:toxin-antitoxin system HicB family antitoxin [Burkholderia vietnamiensis]MCA8211616.1 toxin-antitoxin system HicB family antitoxin [Burkholderia vietnamiensis]HDR9122774.1 toxin-antitoxin system HicB family antitoxin [Burkholderia vietnamiensis]